MPRSDRRIALVSGVTLFLSRFAKGSQGAMGPSGGHPPVHVGNIGSGH